MDYLLARIDTRKKANMRLVLSDKTTYHDVVLDNSREYNDEYKLHEGEWFVVNEFKEKPYFKDWIKEPFNAGDYSQLQVAEYSGLKFLCAVQDGNKFMFQRLFTGNVYEKKTFLSLSVQTEPQLRTDNQLIVINKEPDAIYHLAENKLYFKSIPTVKPLFPGIEMLYKEATNEEVETFLQLDFIQLGGGFAADNVKTPNRRNIKEAKEIYDNYTNDDKNALKVYAQKYRPKLNFNPDTDVCEVTNDDQLKDLIYCILQRFYTTEIGGKKRVAHSVNDM